ncbi:hypothetical protein GCM10011320_57530 [Neoroseomonas lacus]|uniref:Uncharacterized protein n=2 Tax=Neoroseomonas lacus TaxID=287609 RepID=A0A917L660_9PROT|nr:hypothetical protein GCM10011320_57530 [Neoroseomonas lacus]
MAFEAMRSATGMNVPQEKLSTRASADSPNAAIRPVIQYRRLMARVLRPDFQEQRDTLPEVALKTQMALV